MRTTSLAAVLALALIPCAALADDAPPTVAEMYGYGMSLARAAAGGDPKALQTLKTNVGYNDAGAEFGLGEYSLLTKDYPAALSWFQKSAAQGFPGGYYALGGIYESGQGVTQDYAKAMQMYLKAADEIPSAEFAIGRLHALGHGVPKSDTEAASWYRKAAAGGDLDACLELGSLYSSGRGVTQDDSQALQWYRKAADARNMLGEYHVGLLYETSKSFHDTKQAAVWYGKAGQQGVPEAQLQLGLLYARGDGVAKDPAQAIRWFQMAANQGKAEAQYQLAEAFADGAGVPRDVFSAYKWMTIAKTSLDAQSPEYVTASTKLRDWEKAMDAGKVKLAKQAASQWLQDHAAKKE